MMKKPSKRNLYDPLERVTPISLLHLILLTAHSKQDQANKRHLPFLYPL